MLSESYASHDIKEGQAIRSVISLRKAGEELGIDPKVIKGAALALGIELRATGTSLLIAHEDLDRIKRCLVAKMEDAVSYAS